MTTIRSRSMQTSVALSHRSDCWRLHLSITTDAEFVKPMTNSKLQVSHASGTVQRCFIGSGVSQWLALRAGVLRRAVGRSGTAQARGAWCVKRRLKVEIASAVNRPRTPHLQLPLRTDRSKTFSGFQGASWTLSLQPFKSVNLAVGHSCKLQEALANQSLNRTVCGAGQLGFISFSPNCPAPQTAG